MLEVINTAPGLLVPSSSKSAQSDSRRFLFHTAFGSGAAAGLPPFTPPDDLGKDAPRPLPVFATSLGLAAEAAVAGVDARPLDVAGLSPTFADTAPVAPLAARKVLLTDTDLKLVGFLTADEVRAWPFSSSLPRRRSGLDSSVSDPPLMLASAEFTRSSTMSVMCLFSSSSGEAEAAAPFTEDGFESTLCESSVILTVCHHAFSQSGCPSRRPRGTSRGSSGGWKRGRPRPFPRAMTLLTGAVSEVAVASTDRSAMASVAILRCAGCDGGLLDDGDRW